MICKKCGREYDDDMPQCLWCDAPRESEPTPEALYCDQYKDSPEKLVDPELEKSLQDNLYRGKSTISWTKLMIVLNTILFFVEAKTFGTINAGMEAQKAGTPLPNDFFAAWLILAGFLLLILTPASVFVWKNWTWVYHAHKIQSSFKDAFFAPWGAVICFYIPVVNYFMFKDLLKNQNQTLTILGRKAKPVPSKLLIVYIVINITMPICNFWGFRNNNETPYLLLETIIWFIFIFCNIKLIRTGMENERELHTLLYNNAVNHKAEEIIAQRAEGQSTDQA